MLQQAAALLGQHFEPLLAYWILASFASTVALLPVPGAAGFRCAGARSGVEACRGLSRL